MTREERSKQMALVKNKNTKPEVESLSICFRAWLSLSIQQLGKLPGSQFSICKKKKVVFLHGCFNASPSRLFEYTSTQKQC
ncbi:MAG: hypothetical protein ACLU38_09010 [Dysosmobacter sp.]